MRVPSPEPSMGASEKTRRKPKTSKPLKLEAVRSKHTAQVGILTPISTLQLPSNRLHGSWGTSPSLLSSAKKGDPPWVIGRLED